jgi:transaldolase
MKIFIDSAKLNEIKEAYSTGIINGVTTNPSLIKKAVDQLKKDGKKLDMTLYIKKILRVAKGTPVSFEVTEVSYEGIVKQGLRLYKKFNKVAKNVYIKIPVNPSFDDKPNMDGIRAIKTLSKKGIPINCTLIFTPEQALLAAKAGAKFVSPFAGRIDDYIRSNNKIKFEKTDYFPQEGLIKKNRLLEDNGIISGVDLVQQTVKILQKHDIGSEVIAASLRSPRQMRESALVGADIATLPFNVIQQLLIHPKTQEGMKSFTKDVVPEYVNVVKK